MTNDPVQVGRRLRYWRQRRHLERKQFADMVGRSTSWLDKVEKGERELARLPMIERVAEVLNIDPTALTEESSATRAAQCVDATEVQAIREALSRYPDLAARSGKPVSVARLQKQAHYLEHAWTASRFTVIAHHLPQLMAEAQQAIITAPGAERVAAYRALVTSYRLASSMLLKFETYDLAWLAADRAIHAAAQIDDMWSLARATRNVARTLTATGQPTQAIMVSLDMTDQMREAVNQEPQHLLSMYGMLYLSASITAAGQEDTRLALDMHNEARTAAERFKPDYATHETFFGTTNVLIHRVSALVQLHEAGKALEFAETIDPAAVTTLSVERQASYLLDLTEANTRVGRYREASHRLNQAEQIAPEEVRCRPLAHGLLRSLLNNTSGESSRMVRQMAARAGVAA